MDFYLKCLYLIEVRLIGIDAMAELKELTYLPRMFAQDSNYFFCSPLNDIYFKGMLNNLLFQLPFFWVKTQPSEEK